jgi:hypothetical protein
MAATKGTGIFLVFADVPADMEDDFHKWYNEEHIPELLAIPGFLSAARYEAVQGGPRYLAAYELASPEVRDSVEYKEYASRPSEWTQRINLQQRATRFIVNNYRQIWPEASGKVVERELPPVLQIGRMSIPEDQEAEWNNFYNTVYAPEFVKCAGCISARRFELYTGDGPKYSVVYEVESLEARETDEWKTIGDRAGGNLPDLYPRMRHAEGSAGVYKKIFPV